MGDGTTGRPRLNNTTGDLSAVEHSFYADNDNGFGRVAADSNAIITNGVKRIIVGNNTTSITGNLNLSTVGSRLFVAEGSNGISGTATLSSGTVTVNTTKVTANSRIYLTVQNGGLNVGSTYVSTRTAGTSFVITSTNIADASIVAWFIVEPAP
jgi:hypothetical protein